MILKNVRRYSMLMCAFAVSCVFVPAVLSQQPPQNNQVTNQRSPPKIKVYSLMHATSDDAAGVVQQMADADTRVISDGRTNSLIVYSSSEEQLQVIEALLTKLDSQAGETPEVATQIIQFDLRETPQTEELLHGIGFDLIQAVDFDREIIVVRGPRMRVEEFAESLRHLEMVDQKNAAEANRATPALLRVAWLMNGMDENRVKPVPDSMEAAVATLEQVGITDLGLVTQLLVYVEGSRVPFQSEGSLQLPEDVRIIIDGVRESNGAIELNLETMHAQSASGNTRQSPSSPPSMFDTSLRATVSLRPGQLAVLGAAPCGSHDSVFVIELMTQQ